MRRLFILILTLAISHLPFAMGSSFAKETDADVPLKGISASLQPDLFTGILTGSIPIEVPPGRNGMQPNLTLAYSSAGGNGWMGMGWKLEMGAIERQTRWGVLYSPTTAEEQAGKVYTFRLNGVSGDLVQDSVDPNLYRAKNEGGFLRIKKLSTGGWEVTDKKGTKYFFGRTTPFQIQDSVVGIFKWCLERVEDRDGNYMTITYTGDQGQGYLSQIDYTGNGATAPTNQIKFYIEDRPDALSMYTSNFLIKTVKRLRSIDVLANGTRVRAYQLSYENQGNTFVSKFSSLQKFDKNASVSSLNGAVSGQLSLPPQTFSYSQSGAFVTNIVSPGGGYAVQQGSWQVADFNGDGKSDLVHLCCTNYWHMWLKQGPVDNLLTQVKNGYGGNSAVAYLSSTDSQFQNDPGALPFPVQTVSTVTTCDNWNGTSCVGTSSLTAYTYTKGYYHIGERDFRGFQKVEVTSSGASDADKTLTTTEFLQGRGVLSDGVTTLAADDPSVTGDASMEGLPYRVTVAKKTDPTFIYAKTETMYHDDRIGTNTTAPYFTPPAQVDSGVCDGSPCKTTRVTYAATDYDAYGNVKKQSHHGDLVVTGDEKTIERAFVVNSTDYLVSLPVRETVYKGLSVAPADKLAETLFYYDGTGTGVCTAAPTGSNTTVTKGHLTKTERWLNGGTNPISGMEYDPTTGVLLCTRDPRGKKTTLAYDPTKTFVLTTTNQLGHVDTVVISGVNGEAIDPATGFYGKVKSLTDPNGKIITHKYDALGRKTETTAPDGLVTAVTYPTLAEYGVIGTQKITTTTSGGSLPATLTSSTFFDGLGRTITKESSGPNSTTLVTKTEYNVKGQVFRTSLPYFKTSENVTGRWRTMSYDPLGRVTQITHPETLSGNALTTKSCYAPFVTVSIDPSGARKRETKDAYGRVVKIEEYSTTTTTCDTTVGSPYATTNYTYDLIGNLTKVVDHLGNRTTSRYDTLSRKIGMSDPDMSTNGTTTCGDLTALNPNATYPWYAAPCWNYQYDAAGNLTRQTDAKTQHLWFRYDGLNRRSQKDYTTQKAQGSGDVVYVYDDTVTTYNRKGRLKQVIDASGNVTFEYDSRGRISKSSKVLDGTTYVTTSLYDGLGRLKEVTYPTSPAKTVEYLYTGPVLDKVQDKAGSGTTIYVTYSSYTSQSQPQTTTYGNGVVTTNTYADPAHSTCVPANSFKLCTLKTQKGTNPVLQDLTYTFTADGSVDLITDPVNGNQDFGYDALDRLTSATGPYGTGGATATLTYAYNQIGNLTNNSQVGAYTYPTSGAGVVRPHAVTAAGGNSYTYDNNGNMMGGAGRTYTWNLENKPLTIVQGDTTTTTFVYDGDRGRVKKIVGSTTTRYISKLYECDNTNCSRFIWADHTRIATIAASGTIHYWHPDHLGSSSVITDSAGNKAQTVTYYPYGGTRTNQSFTTPAVNVPYKYTGKELDNTGLYYYEARYYDATLGRFISADTIVPSSKDPQSFNRYSYVRNNPLRYTDPTGHCFIVCITITDDDWKTIGGVALQAFGGPMGWAAGSYLLTQTQTGRYILVGEIIALGIALNIACPGCDGGQTVTIASSVGSTFATAVANAQVIAASAHAMYVGFAVGAVAGAGLGGYSAASRGGDISTGMLLGSTSGAIAGASVACVATCAAGVIAGAAKGAVVGEASGLYKSLQSHEDPFKSMLIGGVTGAIGGGIGSTLGPAIPAGQFVKNAAGNIVGGAAQNFLGGLVEGQNLGRESGFGALTAYLGTYYGEGFGRIAGELGGDLIGKFGNTFGEFIADGPVGLELEPKR